jgi:hypothetical protein
MARRAPNPVAGSPGRSRLKFNTVATDTTDGVIQGGTRHARAAMPSPTSEVAMRRLLFGIAASVLILSQSGCLINIYSSDPNRRVLQLLNQSEDLRQIEYEWERIWFTDMPSHLTPERVHGGVMP